MILVRLRHEGDGVYRYGLPGKPVGRLRLDLDTGWPRKLESVDLGMNPDPWITAGAAIRCYWRQHHELPEVLEVVQPPVPRGEPEPIPTARQAPVRQGRLRQVSGRPMSVAEIAARSGAAPAARRSSGRAAGRRSDQPD